MQWTVDARVNCLAKGGGEKKRFQYCLNSYSSGEFLYFRAIPGHSGGNLVDPFLKDNPDNFTEYIYHIRNTFEMHSVIKSGLIPGERKPQKGQTVSVLHSREPDVCSIRCGRSSVRSGQTHNRTVQTHWESSSQHGKMVQFEACSEKGIAIPSNSITCN